jgi:hypothetical protein
MQTLNTNLKEAEKSLEETEYDQWISDQQQLMDDMYTEIEEWLNTRLDDLDGLVQEMIDTTNNNSTSIENTITTETGNVGYTITTEMQNIWNNTNAVVTNFQTDFDNRMVSVLNVINSINSLTKQMLDQANQRAAAEAAAQQAAAQAAAAAAQPAPAPAPAPQPAPAPASNPGGFFIYKEDHYPKNRLRTETSIVDRLKSHNFDSSMGARRMYYEAMGLGSAGSYTGSSGQNMAMLNWMRANGFKKGGTIGSLVNGTGEDGFVLARTGEEILSLEKIAGMKNVLEAFTPFANAITNASTRHSHLTNSIDEINISFELPGVTNADQFIDTLQGNRRFEKIVQEMTVGNMLGNNTLKKYTL